MPTSIRVEGTGDFALPLSPGDLLRLKAASTQAPHGNHVWQVEASKVSCPRTPNFSKVVHDLATVALSELGVDADALGLEVRPYKLLSFEQGGHLKVQRDTGSGVGMFGTMILQLPTRPGHEGGQLEICHSGKSVKFDFSERSMTGYFNTVFFCDCEQKVAEVTRGSMLCLVFGLVRNNAKVIDVDARNLSNYISALGSVQSLLRKQEDLLAIPLSRKYSEDSLSFAGLKGYDRVVAALVLSCANFLDIHLCMLTKVVTENELCESREEEYSIGNWTNIEDSKSQRLKCCGFDIKNVASENYEIDPFRCDQEPDKAYEETGPRGLEEDGLDCMTEYNAAVLVVWPKGKRFKVLQSLSMHLDQLSLLELLDQQPETLRTNTDFQRYLETAKRNIPAADSLTGILSFCIKHDFRDEAFALMKKWWHAYLTNKPEAVLSMIQKYGWDECDRKVMRDVLKRPDLIRMPKVADFPKYLLDRAGLKDAALYFARGLLNGKDLSKYDKQAMINMDNLLKFCCNQGLEEEAWRILARPSLFCGDFFARVVLKWGQRSCSLIEERMKEEEKSLPPLRVDDKGLRKSFLRKVVQFAVAIDHGGYHNTASAFIAKFVKDAEKLWTDEEPIKAVDVFVRLLCRDERLYGKMRRVENCENLLCRMRKHARMIGLKRDDKVTQLFAELLSAEVKAHPNMKLLDNVFWLGDEKIISTVLELAVERHPRLTRVLDKNNFDKTQDACRFFVEKSWKNWDEVGRRGFRELLKARKRMISEDETAEEERDPKRQKCNFVSSRSERIERDKALEKSIAEVERLQNILDSIA